MKIRNALATLPLTLNACGGDSDTVSFSANSLGQGIWQGGFSSQPLTITSASGSISQTELTKIEKTGVGVFASNNKAFFYNIDDDVLYANDTAGFIGSSIIYSPVYYLSGTAYSRVSFSGSAYNSASILGEIASPISDNFAMVFESKYFRGANLQRLTGDWSFSGVNNWSLRIEADGSFTGTSSVVTSCTLSGAFSIIDSGKNEYAISVTLNPDCAPYSGSYQGLAATIDTSNENDTLIMAIYNADYGFFMSPLK